MTLTTRKRRGAGLALFGAAGGLLPQSLPDVRHRVDREHLLVDLGLRPAGRPPLRDQRLETPDRSDHPDRVQGVRNLSIKPQ